MNGLEYGKSYDDEPLQRLIDDLVRNQLASDLRIEVLRKLGVSDIDSNVVDLYSSYAKKYIND